MGQRSFIPVFWILLSLVHFSSAWGYTPTVTSNGIPIRWKQPIKLNFAGNPVGQSGIDSNQFFEASTMGLQRWNAASQNLVRFDYWQGTDPHDYPTQGIFDGLSSIYFLSNSKSTVQLTGNILGMTQVWYNTDSGEILEADIVLNDKDFYFTNHASDTSGFGARTSDFTDTRNNVYIQNVITHELGHALGLSHSGGLQSTMLFMESPEQAHLGCDDQIAVHSIYPTSDVEQRGKFSGRVVSETGSPVFGAHILAISESRGTVLATSITDKAGHYNFDAMEPGRYYLLIEPFFAGPQALPQYYSSVNPSICSEGAPFVRTFYTETNRAELAPVWVQAQFTQTVPDIEVRCKNQIGLPSLDEQSSIVLDMNKNQQNSFAISDQISTQRSKTFRIENASGHLEIHALGYTLYSPLHPTLTLLNSEGTPYPAAEVIDPIYRGDSGFIDYDSALIVDQLPPGTYFIRVNGIPLQANDYPAGPVSLDHIPFFALIGTMNSPPPPLSQTLPINARCHFDENYADYHSPPGSPPRSNSSQKGPTPGFCGTTRSRSKLSEVSAGAIFGWLLPWIVMLASIRIVIRLHGRWHPAKLGL